MRKRLLVALVFAAVGLAIAIPLGERVGLGPMQALAAFGAGGGFVGYLISIFLDIFVSNSHVGEIEN